VTYRPVAQCLNQLLYLVTLSYNVHKGNSFLVNFYNSGAKNVSTWLKYKHILIDKGARGSVVGWARLHTSDSESESELFYDWGFTANHFVLAPSPLRLTPRTLWREDEVVVYNCCWPSSAYSVSGQSPAGLMATFYALWFETPPNWTQVPIFISPRNIHALGSIFVIFYDMQGHDGGNSKLPSHHGGPVCYVLTHKFEADRIQKRASIFLKKLLHVYSTEVNRFTKRTFGFPHIIVLDVKLLNTILTSFLV
jgi:hypothetical protein